MSDPVALGLTADAGAGQAITRTWLISPELAAQIAAELGEPDIEFFGPQAPAIDAVTSTHLIYEHDSP